MFRKFGFILFFFLLINNISLSKNNFFILATVNDEIITNYDINKEMYSKPIISFVNKILNKLFSNLETYLCKITT